MTQNRSIRTCLALSVTALALAACDEGTSASADSSSDGSTAPSDAEDAEIDASAEVIQTVKDRCNGTSCGLSRLVPQEDLEFLEDMGDGWLRLMEADWDLCDLDRLRG